MQKIAIVTGGARGIGKAITETLAQNGIKVIANYNKSKEQAEKLKKELEEKYDDSYEEYINILGEIRQKVIKNYKNISERKKVLKDLVNLDLEELKTLENKF